MGFFRRPTRSRQQILRLPAPRALTASAFGPGIQAAREKDAKSHAPIDGQRSRIELALGFYTSLGECRGPSQFYAQAMQRIRYYPAILDENGDPEEVEEGPLRELFDAIHDPGGTSFPLLASNYGRLAFLIGDGYLIASEQDGEVAWEYLSPLELKPVRNTAPQEYERDNGVDGKQTLVEAGENEDVAGDRVRVWRLWRRHPARSGWSDAPVLSVLELYALLERLRLAMGATSWSRAAQRDALYLPDEVSIVGGSDPNDPGVDEDPLEDSTLRETIEAFISPIKDPGSVEGAAPLIFRGPGAFLNENGQAMPFADLIKRIQIGRDNPYFETEACNEIISWLAIGLDMPNEMVTGTGKVNHWGGWLLDEVSFRKYVAPTTEDFCGDLNSAYLKPAAIAAEIENADRVVVWYDAVAAIAHPDEGPNAKDAWENGAVGRAFYRDKIGATDEDAPTPEDEAFLLELKGRSAAVDQRAGETAPQDGGTGGDTTEGPPAEPAPSDQNGNGVTASSDFHRAAMIVGAAEMQLRQARKAAGARLVQRSKRCGECQDAIRDVPHGLVAATMGREMVRSLINGHTTEAALVQGVGELLAEQVRAFGLEAVAEQLGAMVESHAQRTLYDVEAPPLPAGFLDKVERALAA